MSLEKLQNLENVDIQCQMMQNNEKSCILQVKVVLFDPDKMSQNGSPLIRKSVSVVAEGQTLAEAQTKGLEKVTTLLGDV